MPSFQFDGLNMQEARTPAGSCFHHTGNNYLNGATSTCVCATSENCNSAATVVKDNSGKYVTSATKAPTTIDIGTTPTKTTGSSRVDSQSGTSGNGAADPGSGTNIDNTDDLTKSAAAGGANGASGSQGSTSVGNTLFKHSYCLLRLNLQFHLCCILTFVLLTTV